MDLHKKPTFDIDLEPMFENFHGHIINICNSCFNQEIDPKQYRRIFKQIDSAKDNMLSVDEVNRWFCMN